MKSGAARRISRLLQVCAMPWRWPLLAAFSGLLAGAASFPIIFYFYSGWAWNLIGVSGDFSAMLRIAGACLGLVLLAQGLEALASYLAIHVGADLLRVLCLAVHQHAVQRLPHVQSAQSAQSPQSPQAPLSSLYAQNIEQLVQHLQAFLARFPRAMASLAVFFLIIIVNHPGIALLTVALAIATLVLPPWVAAHARTHIQQEAPLMAHTMQALHPFFLHYRTVGGVLQGRAWQQVGALMLPHHINQAAKWFYWNSSFNLKTLLNLLTLSVVLIYGGWQVLQGELMLAQLFSLFLAISLILPRFNDLYEAHFHFSTSGHHAAILLRHLRAGSVSDGVADSVADGVSDCVSDSAALLRPQQQLRLQLPAFSFASQAILPALDVCFPVGKLIIISGPSGCGKTTLAQILAGLLPAPGASISVDDAPGLPNSAVLGQVAYIGQTHGFFEHMSAVQNIACQLQVAPALQQQILAAAHRFGLSPDSAATAKLQDPAHSLNQHFSGGEQQRLHLLQGLFAPQKIRIFDEPTAALDVASADKVKQVLAQVPQDEVRIVITHDQHWPVHADQCIYLTPVCP